PAKRALRAANPRLGVEHRGALDRFAPVAANALAIALVDLLEPPMAELILFGDARVVDPLVVQIVARAVRLTAEDEVRERLGELAQLAGLLAQARLELLRRGRVGEGHDHAVDEVLERAIRKNAHQVPAPV